MSYEIALEQTYAFPPDRVWHALTDSAALASWLMPNNFEPCLGHKFRFQSKPMPGWRGFVECEVLEIDPPKRLVYSWLGDRDWQAPTLVSWTLKPIDGGTMLRLEHTGFQDPWGQEVHSMFSQGWKKMLSEKILRSIQDYKPAQ
jgi:uncharacterized protein YndB with AHSA1/START domain